MYFNSKVGTAKFALHAGDAGLRVDNFDNKKIHFENLGGAEFSTDTAPLAVFFDDLYFSFGLAHSDLSPFV
jgi:hypothetical protein